MGSCGLWAIAISFQERRKHPRSRRTSIIVWTKLNDCCTSVLAYSELEDDYYSKHTRNRRPITSLCTLCPCDFVDSVQLPAVYLPVGAPAVG